MYVLGLVQVGLVELLAVALESWEMHGCVDGPVCSGRLAVSPQVSIDGYCRGFLGVEYLARLECFFRCNARDEDDRLGCGRQGQFPLMFYFDVLVWKYWIFL